MFSNDNRDRHSIVKVKDGAYQKFEGLTVICPLLGMDSTFLEEQNYPNYLFLPPSSYHMTLMNLWTRRHFITAEDYNYYNKSRINNFSQLKQYLDTTERFSMRVTEMEISGGIGLVLMPISGEVEYKLNKMQGEIEKIVKSNLIAAPLYYHLTLAYGINDKLEDSVIPLDMVLHFGPPRLCEFKDMTKFTEC
jgi:hypothetical protein